MAHYVGPADRSMVTPPKSKSSGGALAAALLGGLFGLLVGIIGILAFWLVIFSRALAGNADSGIPGFIEISEEESGSVFAVLEPTVLLAPLLLLIAGVVLGYVTGNRRSRRASA